VLPCAGPLSGGPQQRLLPTVNPAMAIGQDIVAVFLIVAILLQARGSGLSATFGGDSSVYRSRRGIERRLWQFTILLAILFCMFSVGGYLVKV
jgi:preprotein translocase subunit SecG